LSRGPESGCSEDEGMWVTKYSWKQRRWRAGGLIEELEGMLEARLQARQATGGLRAAAERRTDGFHMLSLPVSSGRHALWCRHGNYVMVGIEAKTGVGVLAAKPSRLPSS
jgi:hypothetical protein